MKKATCLIVSVFLGVAPLCADYQKGNQSLTLSFGPLGYSDEIKVNNGENKLRDCGGAGNVQYLYVIRTGPTIAIGPDILWADLSEKNNSSLLPNSVSHGAERTAVYQGVLKLTYPSGHWRPYVLGGLGAARSSLQGDITSATTFQSQQTFDSVRYGFAGTWGVGMDFFPREHWSLGLEFRQIHLSQLSHQPTAAGQALGIEPVRDPRTMAALMLKLGYKFGAS